MEKKSPKSEKEGREIPLPEEIIHHIQSFMSRVEAARTTVFSKSWRKAWLTRPSLYFDVDDYRGFRYAAEMLSVSANNTLKRYQDSSLKIDSFTLRCPMEINFMASHLIVSAMETGATDLDLELKRFYHVLPQEVLESATLVRLSLRGCTVDGNYEVRCSALKSLALEDVNFTSYDMFKKLIKCCSASIEELSLSNCEYAMSNLSLEGMNMYELHNLKRLRLHSYMAIDSMFFSNFASRFPFLNDLSIEFNYAVKGIQIASNSLETISFKVSVGASNCKAQFDVPNIRKFTCYSGSGLPDISIHGGSRVWDLDLSIRCNRFCTKSWFLRLSKMLTKFRPSNIFLHIYLNCIEKGCFADVVNTEVVRKPPLVLENLMIDGLTSHCCALLAQLFGICRPKFITHYWITAADCHPVSSGNDFLDVLCKILMHTRITPNSGIPDEKVFGVFKLKSVNVEVYEMCGTEWNPLVLKKPLDASQTPAKKMKIRFQLIWEED